MKLLPIITCTLLLTASWGWKFHTETSLNKSQWLLGTWVNQTKTGKTYESWQKINGNEFAGKSYMLNGKDTFTFETIKLLEHNGSLLYIPVVQGQNNNKPVQFTLTTFTENKLVFTNPKHDFPQTISYSLINENSLLAEISGMVGGKKKTQTFSMQKIN